MQIITIAGNIGKNAELRRTQTGDSIANFSVAVSEGRDKPPTWWDVSLFGKRGEKLAPHLTKGSRVSVVGRFSTREYEGKTYLQCAANEVALQGGGQRDSDQSNNRQAAEGGQPGGYSGGSSHGGGFGGHLDDEIPFFAEVR